MDITILGSGNVATYYGKALFQQGWTIKQVYSPTLVNAAILAKEIGAKPTDNLQHINDQSSIYIVAVKDDAFEQVLNCPALKDKIIIHCSGSNSLEVFGALTAKLGVMWPLYSVKKEHLPQNRNVPIIVDASDEILKNLLHRLANTVTDNVHFLGNEARTKLHLNAVLVNNFTNHLYAMAEEICLKSNIDFSILLPIMQQGLENVTEGQLNHKQTGPAIRNDWATIQKHLALLQQMNMNTSVYESITQSIVAAQVAAKQLS